MQLALHRFFQGRVAGHQRSFLTGNGLVHVGLHIGVVLQLADLLCQGLFSLAGLAQIGTGHHALLGLLQLDHHRGFLGAGVILRLLEHLFPQLADVRTCDGIQGRGVAEHPGELATVGGCLVLDPVADVRRVEFLVRAMGGQVSAFEAALIEHVQQAGLRPGFRRLLERPGEPGVVVLQRLQTLGVHVLVDFGLALRAGRVLGTGSVCQWTVGLQQRGRADHLQRLRIRIGMVFLIIRQVLVGVIRRALHLLGKRLEVTVGDFAVGLATVLASVDRSFQRRIVIDELHRLGRVRAFFRGHQRGSDRSVKLLGRLLALFRRQVRHQRRPAFKLLG